MCICKHCVGYSQFYYWLYPETQTQMQISTSNSTNFRPSVGFGLSEDKDIQINAFHYVPKLLVPVYLQWICFDVVSTSIQV